MSNTESNRLIAEFMGCTQSFDTFFNKEEQFHFSIEETEYHSNWSWLMPVVEKIRSLVFRVDIDITPIDVSIRFLKDGVQFACAPYWKNTIDAVYNGVLAFIEWYNKQKEVQDGK
jgi:hypothetical protein